MKGGAYLADWLQTLRVSISRDFLNPLVIVFYLRDWRTWKILSRKFYALIAICRLFVCFYGRVSGVECFLGFSNFFINLCKVNFCSCNIKVCFFDSQFQHITLKGVLKLFTVALLGFLPFFSQFFYQFTCLFLLLALFMP